MNDVQLRSFTAAVELGSFNKAAKGQFLSVPSFAQRINSLEAELGYRILERGPSGVRPTDAGLVLYRAAKEALDILDKAREEGRSVAEEQPAERVTIGVWWQVHPFMMEAVRQMAQTHPRLKIDFVETSYGNAAEGFAQGLFDLFFSADSLALRQMGASFTPLSREKYYCVFSPDSPLAKRETISTDLLENITVYAGADYRDVPELHEFESFFARDNVVKESIFREKLTMDCLENMPAAGSAPHGVAAPRLRSPRPSRCAARRARRAGCLHRQLQANRLSRCRRGARYAGYCSSTVTRRTPPSREAAAVAPIEAASWETMAKPKPAPALDRAPPPW